MRRKEAIDMKRFGTFALMLTLALTMTACSMSPNAAEPSASPTSMASSLESILDVTAHPRNTEEAAETAAMSAQESAALSKKANDAAGKISEIDGCVTAIYGDTCLAGVSFTEKYSGKMTDRIRDMVADRIRSVAPSVQQVAVTADPEVAAEISRLSEKIGAADKLSELSEEFSSVMQKMQ